MAETMRERVALTNAEIRDLHFMAAGHVYAASLTGRGIRLRNQSGARVIPNSRWQRHRVAGWIGLATTEDAMFVITPAGRAALEGVDG